MFVVFPCFLSFLHPKIGRSLQEKPAPATGITKVAHCSLQKIYFDAIKSGQKSIEFRQASEYWQKRFHNASHLTVAQGRAWSALNLLAASSSLHFATLHRIRLGTATKLGPFKILQVEKVNRARAAELGAPVSDAGLFKDTEEFLAVRFENTAASWQQVARSSKAHEQHHDS